MNRQRYRLVFNARVGKLVAVAETARGRGKQSARGAGLRSAGSLLGALLVALPALAELPVPSAGGAIPGFVTAGQAGYQVNGNQALVNQVGNKAILNWQRFNLSAGQSVQFRQVDSLTNPQLVPGANFTTLNRVWDINPSVIAGSIGQAAGQSANVILVNSNGIAFMGGSQVNLNSFTASTLNMADRFVLDRLLGDNLVPQFERALDGSQARAFVKVFEGANITATSQGRVMLIAPTVVNRGQISAPDGQVILAAGTRAFLRADDSEDLNLRGLLVEVDSATGLNSFASPNTEVKDGELDGQAVSLRNPGDDLLGHATNIGSVSTPRGNVTMVGYAVNQQGMASATSSVVANGSVYLMAKDTRTGVASSVGSSRGGQLTLGAGSLTTVLPETTDATATVDGASGSGQADASQVRLLGQTVTLKSGSVVRAPSADVVLTAVDNPFAALAPSGALVDSPLNASATARLHIERGARIDVSGLQGVAVSAARNTVEVELRGDELKDSPVNRNGPLRGQKAFVDIEQALANADAGKDTLIARDSLENYRAQLQRGIAERSTRGGQVALRSQGETLVEQGAVVDLSGGSVAFQQGVAKTTVLGANGQLVDLADAEASTRYSGIVSRFVVDYQRWNEREVIELPSAQRVVQAYTEGKDAGSLSIQSAGPAFFQADVQGRTVVGERQAASGQAPRGARLTVGAEANNDFRINQRVVLSRDSEALPGGFTAGGELPESLRTTLAIDADLLAKDGVAELTVFSNQAAEVRDALRVAPGGRVNITAPEVTVRADIDVPGGQILLAGRSAQVGAVDTLVSVDAGVELTARGEFQNRQPGAGGGAATALARINGGSISLNAQSQAEGSILGEYLSRGNVVLGEGVVMDASAGVAVDPRGAIRQGRAGSLTVTGFSVAGLDGAELSAWGFGRGGSLTLGAYGVQIGGALPTQADTLWLSPNDFIQGGFAQYNIRALDRLTVAANTLVTPVMQQRELTPQAIFRASGTALDQISRTVLREPTERAGASVLLSATNTRAGTGDLTVEQGARVEVDPGSKIALEARNRVELQGTLVARGGQIAATQLLRNPQAGPVSNSPGLVWLGQQAVIDASGVVQTARATDGTLQGQVRNGGTVQLDALNGSVVTQQGSLMNVSGAAPVRLDELNEGGSIGRERSSDAGTVRLFGDESLVLDGAFLARGGSAQQSDGTLELGLGTNARLDGQVGFDTQARTLALSNQVAPQPSGLTPETFLSPLGQALRARIGTDALEAAGFDRLRFSSGDGITLADGLNLGAGRSRPLAELQLDAARIETDQSNVVLNADVVRLGNYDTRNRVGTAGSTANGGTLTAQGRLVELAGNLRLQGMTSSELTGSEQVRLDGVNQRALGSDSNATGPFARSANIATTGDLLLRGGVVAPGSLAQVQINAAGRDVRIESVGTAPIAPLSALGSVQINAQNITQAGRLVAPLGRIELNARDNLSLTDGSVTSVAGVAGQTVPLGQIQNSTDWVVSLDPSRDGQVALNQLPEKSVRLNGGNVALQAGSTVNVSGGGDLQAYEFTVGPGGSADILAEAGTYAILPGQASGFAPSDPQQTLDQPVGSAVYLSGVIGLPDGTYTLLPAHYALLPGALAVRLNDDTPLFPGQAFTRQDGVRVAAGYLTDSRTGASRQGDWRSVEVLTRDQVQQRSEFTLTQASDFFDGAPSRPSDAGLLSLATLSRLELDGQLLGTAAAGGRGSSVDISAPELLIVSASNASAPAGSTTVVAAERLNSLGADSLFLGGTRSQEAQATRLDVQTTRLTLANDATTALRVPELFLAAQDTLTLAPGATVDSTGSAAEAQVAPTAFLTRGNGAAVIASARPVTFSRTGSPDRSAGTLVGDTSSVVRSSRSIVLDATNEFAFSGQTEIRNDGLLSVGASRISLGETGAPVEGLNLTQAELDGLGSLDTLTLTSYSTVDLFGDVRVGSVDTAGNNSIGRLSIQAAGLSGRDNAGATATIRADRVALSNPQTAQPATTGAIGSGTLNVITNQLVLGEGDKAVEGFSRINVRTGDLVAQGRGRTELRGQTQVEAVRLVGAVGSAQSLDAGVNLLAITQGAATPSGMAAGSGLGAGWNLRAASLNFDTAAALPSGQLALSATAGDLSLGDNARISVAGRDVAFFNTSRGTAGGDVSLSSATGNVSLAAGARMDVSGAAGADGGRFNVQATQGNVNLGGDNLLGRTTVDAQGTSGAGSRARIDVGRLDNPSAVFSALQTSGIDGEVQIRARQGDVVVATADTVAARNVQLSADTGSILVAGTVSASAVDGGQVGLYAGESLVLENSARVSATATAVGGDGGRVTLAAARGTLDLRAGSEVDVSAGAGGKAGELKLRALRSGSDVSVAALQTTVRGAERVDLEAVRVYNNINTLNASGASTGSTLSLSTLNSNDNAFAANHAAIKTRLGQDANPAFHIVSGSEVRSAGNLNLGNGSAASDWNLANSVAGGEAGVLTLRAQGNININSNLSDGFSNATPLAGTAFTSPPATLLDNAVRGGQSWSYRLAAGADATAANPMDTAAGAAGDLVLAAGKLVRTGSGDIQMAAARDIRLASDASVVYTAGRLSAPLPGFVEPIARQRASFTENGGDVSLNAGRNIEGSPSSQLYSQWLWRQGALNDTGNYAAAQGTPAWWVRFDLFGQGVATLGGGDVSLVAGGNVRNLSASAPTQGRMASAVPDLSRLVKTGGGNVTVEAGADVLSGQYFADGGHVRVVAGGQVGSGYSALAGGAVYTVVALGDGRATVRAKDDVNLHTVVNPTLLPQYSGAIGGGFDRFNISGTGPQQPAQRISFFSTYGSGTAATMSSLNGDAVLRGGTGGGATANLGRVHGALFTGFPNNSATLEPVLNYLPPSLDMVAYSGDVKVAAQPSGNRMVLLPAASGRLNLLAQEGVQLNATLLQSDNDPAVVASVLRPVTDPLVALSRNPGALHGAVPVHAGGTSTAKVYAVRGDIQGVSNAGAFLVGSGTSNSLTLAQAAEVRAGRDIVDFNLDIQHANASDRSLVQAGRDVLYSVAPVPTENDGIRIGGEGSLTVSAQRNINLGASGGLLSRGDLDNANLPARGANLEVLAGVGPNGLDAAGTLQRLAIRISAGPVSETDLSLARWLTGNPSLDAAGAPEAVNALTQLSAPQQADRVRDFVFTALRETGRDANRAESGFAGSFDRGYAALELVFPGIGTKDDQGRFANYAGGVNLFASRIKTERGGNIDILVPGGGLVVGLANTPAALVDVGNNVLGVVASQTGDIRAFTRDDMLVNQSRILTVGGGDVLLWSSEGDIDAGKGKKTASAVPPPVIKVDAQGNVTQELLGAASGSGIGALSTNGVPAGDVDLIAPRGTVDAGDAGIRAGNLNIAAQVVLGADNISVTGTSAGTPVADISAVTAASSGASGGSDDSARTVEALNQAAAESAQAAQEIAASLRPSVVRVDVLGYGE